MSALTTVLVDLFIIYAAARLAGIVFTRLGQPGVIGELLAGVLIGSHALGLVGTPDGELIDLFHGNRDDAAHALDLALESVAELGVIILLFTVGLETRLTDILRVGVRAALVGVLGIVTPFALGFAFMAATGHPSLEAAFVATALVATSVGITARVLQELGVLRTREARIILGAAVIDDILGLLLLAIVSASGAENGGDTLNVALIAVQAVLFVGFIAWVGTHASRRYSVRLLALDERTTFNAPLSFSLLVMLGLAALASIIGLAGIIGAFLAGMVLAETRERFDLEHQSRPIAEFLVPFFFVYTGTKVDPAVFLDGGLVLVAAAVTAIAIASKLLGAGLAMWGTGRRGMLIVGVGMVPRGEVGLIVAGLGLRLGIIPVDVFSVVVIMSIVTTLVVPPVLYAIYRRSPEVGASSVITRDVSDEFDLDTEAAGMPTGTGIPPAPPSSSSPGGMSA
jgi:Kef-type K+ transport system membrane component KefB